MKYVLLQHIKNTKRAIADLFIKYQLQQSSLPTEERVNLSIPFWINKITQFEENLEQQDFPKPQVADWIGYNANVIRETLNINCPDTILKTGAMRAYVSYLYNFFAKHYPNHPLLTPIRELRNNWFLGIKEINDCLQLEEKHTNGRAAEINDHKNDAKLISPPLNLDIFFCGKDVSVEDAISFFSGTSKEMASMLVAKSVFYGRDKNVRNNYLQRPDGTYIADETNLFIIADKPHTKAYLDRITRELATCTNENFREKLTAEHAIATQIYEKFSGETVLEYYLKEQHRIINEVLQLIIYLIPLFPADYFKKLINQLIAEIPKEKWNAGIVINSPFNPTLDAQFNRDLQTAVAKLGPNPNPRPHPLFLVTITADSFVIQDYFDPPEKKAIEKELTIHLNQGQDPRKAVDKISTLIAQFSFKYKNASETTQGASAGTEATATAAASATADTTQSKQPVPPSARPAP